MICINIKLHQQNLARFCKLYIFKTVWNDVVVKKYPILFLKKTWKKYSVTMTLEGYHTYFVCTEKYFKKSVFFL